MTLLYYNPLFLEHQTGPHHPERPERLVMVMRQLERSGLAARCERPTWERVSSARLARVHRLDYAASVEAFARGGGGRIEEDTVCSPKSNEAALLAAGAVCDAVRRVVPGHDRQALCLVRPPGHHALNDAPMGFCLYNSVAIGARMAIAELELDRVLVVDWDVHHGNGTQATFWTDRQVGFLSIHRWPFYPGTGAANETGEGPGLGTTLNLPVEFGTSRESFIAQFRGGLERMAAKMRPQLILLSAGFDAHRDDPVGSLGLEIEDFADLTAILLDVAKAECGGRLVSALEGGYNTGALAGSVEAHLGEMLKRSTPADAPPRS
jgi:acetoin utilization deacetylase AcuC-like enzyme